MIQVPTEALVARRVSLRSLGSALGEPVTAASLVLGLTPESAVKTRRDHGARKAGPVTASGTRGAAWAAGGPCSSPASLRHAMSGRLMFGLRIHVRLDTASPGPRCPIYVEHWVDAHPEPEFRPRSSQD